MNRVNRDNNVINAGPGVSEADHAYRATPGAPLSPVGVQSSLPRPPPSSVPPPSPLPAGDTAYREEMSEQLEALSSHRERLRSLEERRRVLAGCLDEARLEPLGQSSASEESLLGVGTRPRSLGVGQSGRRGAHRALGARPRPSAAALSVTARLYDPEKIRQRVAKRAGVAAAGERVVRRVCEVTVAAPVLCVSAPPCDAPNGTPPQVVSSALRRSSCSLTSVPEMDDDLDLSASMPDLSHYSPLHSRLDLTDCRSDEGLARHASNWPRLSADLSGARLSVPYYFQTPRSDKRDSICSGGGSTRRRSSAGNVSKGDCLTAADASRQRSGGKTAQSGDREEAMTATDDTRTCERSITQSKRSYMAGVNNIANSRKVCKYEDMVKSNKRAVNESDSSVDAYPVLTDPLQATILTRRTMKLGDTSGFERTISGVNGVQQRVDPESEALAAGTHRPGAAETPARETSRRDVNRSSSPDEYSDDSLNSDGRPRQPAAAIQSDSSRAFAADFHATTDRSARESVTSSSSSSQHVPPSVETSALLGAFDAHRGTHATGTFMEITRHTITTVDTAWSPDVATECPDTPHE